MSSLKPLSIFQTEPKSAPSRIRRTVILGLKVLLAAGVLFYLAKTQRLGFSKLSLAWQNPLLLAAALLGLLLVPLVLAVRWGMFLRSRSHYIPFRHVLGLTFTAIFFDTLMPGGTADVVRGYLFDRQFQPSRRASAAVTVLIDRFVGIMGLVVLAMGALLVESRRALGAGVANSIVVPTTVVLGILTAAFGFLAADHSLGRGTLSAITRRFPRTSILLRLYDALRGDGGNLSSMVRGLGWSLLGHLLVVMSFAALVYALGERRLSLTDFLFLVPVGLFLAQVPIAPAGIGVGHAAFYSLFALRGSHVGAAAFSLYIVVRFLSSLPGWAYFVAMKRQTQTRAATGAQIKVPFSPVIECSTEGGAVQRGS